MAGTFATQVAFARVPHWRRRGKTELHSALAWIPPTPTLASTWPHRPSICSTPNSASGSQRRPTSLKQLKRGEAAGNRLVVAELRGLDRDLLRDALRVTGEFKAWLKSRFNLE